MQNAYSIVVSQHRRFNDKHLLALLFLQSCLIRFIPYKWNSVIFIRIITFSDIKSIWVIYMSCKASILNALTWKLRTRVDNSCCWSLCSKNGTDKNKGYAVTQVDTNFCDDFWFSGFERSCRLLVIHMSRCSFTLIALVQIQRCHI